MLFNVSKAEIIQLYHPFSQIDSISVVLIDDRGRFLFIIHETFTSVVLIDERGPIKLVDSFF